MILFALTPHPVRTELVEGRENTHAWPSLSSKVDSADVNKSQPQPALFTT
jgi:hypothetical protein